MISADSIRVVHPLFQEEGDGSQPISALQLRVVRISAERAMYFNRDWHSRLPQLTNWQHCFVSFGATYLNRFYAIALWSHPVARPFNNMGILELRRMAIAPDAPTNTGSRFLRVMALIIVREIPGINRLISYQDTAVHKGTIYKAAGWQAKGFRKGSEWSCPSRHRDKSQSTSDKIRWEKKL